MSDIDFRPCISEHDQTEAAQPFAHFWNQLIGCDTKAQAQPAATKFEETHEVKDQTIVGNAFQSDVGSPIANITLPDGWKKTLTERGGIGQRALDEFSPADGSSVKISLFQEGLPVSKRAVEAVSSVLGKGNHQLMPNEIAAVRDVIGYSNAGDNQYTNKNYRPAFNLTSAGVSTIDNEQVLVVEGRWNAGGKMFKGVYAPYVDSQGQTRVQQIFMEGAASEFPKHLSSFNTTLNSIDWKDGSMKRSDTPRQQPEAPPHEFGLKHD